MFQLLLAVLLLLASRWGPLAFPTSPSLFVGVRFRPTKKPLPLPSPSPLPSPLYGVVRKKAEDQANLLEQTNGRTNGRVLDDPNPNPNPGEFDPDNAQNTQQQQQQQPQLSDRDSALRRISEGTAVMDVVTRVPVVLASGPSLRLAQFFPGVPPPGVETSSDSSLSARVDTLFPSELRHPVERLIEGLAEAIGREALEEFGRLEPEQMPFKDPEDRKSDEFDEELER